jgi:tetratricopeptide (TPR) repeat protein
MQHSGGRQFPKPQHIHFGLAPSVQPAGAPDSVKTHDVPPSQHCAAPSEPTHGSGLGRTADALAQLDEAVALADQTGLHYWDVELRRMRGAFLARSDPASAESCLLQAIEIARRQDAKWLELRAATDLARVWQRRGERKRARALLGEIRAWFTEGFETRDLLDASALLEELGDARERIDRART